MQNDDSTSTSGLELKSRSRVARELVEVVSSMRFAIALLTLICIASVIGTVVRQHDPYPNYVNQFGPFWASAFDKLGLYAVYSAGWFLLILTFLVISTSLCIARNLPKIVADLKTYKEHLRASSLRAFHHKAEGELDAPRDAVLRRVSALLVSYGWRAKVQQRPEGVMVAAKKGGVGRLGYLAAHSAIVLVCIGGLLDGDLVVRAQMALQGKTSYGGAGFLREVPPEHVLSASNPTYRANLAVSEGTRAGTAVINLSDGVVLQPLPFDVELKRFIVEYYDTGMPKLFASEVVLHDRDTGKSTPATIKVNEPAVHRGITLYQSSFEDGGSSVHLTGWPIGAGKPFTVDTAVGASSSLKASNAEPLGLEITGLRVINVENLGGAADGATDVRKVDLVDSLERHLGSGAKSASPKQLHNVGPSVSYKLRDASGQAREFNNYMLPITLDGQRVFLAGLRERPDEPFRYLRIPADDSDSIASWAQMRAALSDPAARSEAVRRYVALAVPADKPQLAEQLRVSALRAIDLFAGVEAPRSGLSAEDNMRGGLQAVAAFMESNVPAADRARTSEVLIRILNGTLYELLNLSRERAGLPAMAPGDKTQAFMTQAVLSLSDSFYYPAPALLQLADFKQVQASVFQVTRTPGKSLVYLGCLLLILGVFAMLYVRERRLWVWLEDAGDSRTLLRTALSTTRRTMDTDHEFEHLSAALLAAPTAPEARA
jgi:cytochrome c biogenesis protein